MVQVFQASELTLGEVKARFGLSEVSTSDFFLECQVNMPQLTDYERQLLDRARADFRYMAQYPVHEALVKMVVLAPVMSAAGFYSHPFQTAAEKTIELTLEEQDEIIRGRIDLLVINQSLWVAVIESKGKKLNWLEALPQALIYMMSDQAPAQKRFGLVTNGTELVFIKLLKDARQYGLSKVFSLYNPGNDLYEVVGVLRTLSLPKPENE